MNDIRLDDFFEEIKAARGKEKQRILDRERGNSLLKRVFKATYEPMWQYNVRLTERELAPSGGWKYDGPAWEELLWTLKCCRLGKLSGKEARDRMCFVIEDARPALQPWMVRVVNRHLEIGVGIKTINGVWDGLISTFECQLAQKFDLQRIEGDDLVAVEPKLDGVRCVAVVGPDRVPMLFTRSGKRVTNFEVCIGSQLTNVVDTHTVFDGELMPVTGTFQDLMRVLFRKGADVHAKYFVFDVMSLDEWSARRQHITCRQAYERLEDMCLPVKCPDVELVERRIVSPDDVSDVHAAFVEQGYEGTMVKRLDESYTWGRTWNMMKLKDFHTVDLRVTGFIEGTGRMKDHVGSLSAVYEGRRVKVARGAMTHKEAHDVWLNRSDYRGTMMEVAYQELTDDGSLRFPKFVRWRHDK